MRPVSRASYDISQKGYDRYREYRVDCRKFDRKRGTTGIVANLTGKIGATGIESIASIVANLTRKGVGIPRKAGSNSRNSIPLF
jgi:hypothetical protein